jgi:hypothetical protein
VIPHLEDIKVFEIAEFEKVFFEKNKNLSIRFKDLNQQSDRILFFEIPSFIENKGTTFFSEDRCILEKTIEGFDSPLEITLIQENKIKQALLITGALLLGFLQIIIFSIRTRKKVALVVTTGLIFYLSSSQLGKIQHQHAATKKNTQLALIAYKAGTERFKEHVLAVSQYLMDCFESDHTLIHHQNVFDKWPYLKNIRYENSSNFTLVELKNPKNKTQPSLISIFQKWEGWQAPKQTQDSTSYFFSLKNKEAYVILEIDPFPVVRPIEVIEQLLSIRCDLKAQLTDQNSKNQIDFYIDVIPRSKLNPKNLCCILLTLVSGLATLTSYLSCILGTVQIGYFSATGFTKRPTLATFNKNI